MFINDAQSSFVYNSQNNSSSLRFPHKKKAEAKNCRVHVCIAKMMAPPLVHAAVLWTLFLSLLLPTTTKALAVKGNSMKDFVKDIFSRGVEPKDVVDRDRGASVLEQLNLSSSTDPKRFYARPQQLPSLLTASMLVRYSLTAPFALFVSGSQAAFARLVRTHAHDALVSHDCVSLSGSLSIGKWRVC